MTILDLSSTIAAIATPMGKGGIGIIKLSGPLSISIIDSLFHAQHSQQSLRPAKINSGVTLKTHHLNYGVIKDPDNGQVIDEVLVAIMAAPHSYTREDVVEINAHSGIFVLKQIYHLVINAGAIPAEPGEFTKRAFINGRIDLVQAEAVIDLINARSAHAASLASNQLQTGSNDRALEIIRERILGVLANIEAAIDFPDDIDDELPLDGIAETCRDIIRELIDLILSFDRHRLFRDGIKVAIVGRPNVGKSSILNRLVESDRAIVTDIPGTTRDIIDVDLYIKGIPVIITDTAGLRHSHDEIEVLGMKKTRERVRHADIVLFVLALDEGITAEDENIYQEIKNRNIIYILNKDDLINKIGSNFVDFGKSHPKIKVSALKDPSFKRVRSLIYEQIVDDDGIEIGTGFVPNLRQKTLLEQCHHSLSEAVRLLGQSRPVEIIALEVRGALNALDELSGGDIGEDLLNHIFSQFCIGK